MNKLIRNCCVLILALIAGMVWLDAMAAKPVKVTVTSAFPESAYQGDYEEVEIDGTGFDDGSTARFIVTDSRDDTQIDVIDVEFVAPGKLKAKIKVKDAALPVEYDIEVMTSTGRRGKGTTMFRVQEKAGQDDPCVVLTSYFPAFAYVVSRDGAFDIHLSSADGACSIPIYNGGYSFNGNISYRYYDQGNGFGTGLISWAQNKDDNLKKKDQVTGLPVIRLLEFHVTDYTVAEPLPLSSEVLYMGPDTIPEGNTFPARLAPMADRILFGGFENYTVYFLSELDLVDCSDPPCINRVIEGDKAVGLGPSKGNYGATTDRIYFALKDREELPDYVAFIDRLGDAWTEPAIMLEYVTESITRIDFGLWDWDSDGTAEEVLAVSTVKYPSVHAIDIWGHMESAEWSLIDSIPGGEGATFKSLDGHPVLLFEYEESTVTGPAILEYDLNAGSIRTVVDVITGGDDRISGIDAAD